MGGGDKPRRVTLGRGLTEKKCEQAAYFFSAGAFSTGCGGVVAAAGGNNGAVALDAGISPGAGATALVGALALGTDKSMDLVGKPFLSVEPSSMTDVGARVPWLPKTVSVSDVTKKAPAKIVVVRVMKVVAERPDIMLDGPPPIPSAPPPSERCNKIAPIKNKQINKWTDNRIGIMLWIMVTGPECVNATHRRWA
jgi:hypothetical protein